MVGNTGRACEQLIIALCHLPACAVHRFGAGVLVVAILSTGSVKDLPNLRRNLRARIAATLDLFLSPAGCDARCCLRPGMQCLACPKECQNRNCSAARVRSHCLHQQSCNIQTAIRGHPPAQRTAGPRASPPSSAASRPHSRQGQGRCRRAAAPGKGGAKQSNSQLRWQAAGPAQTSAQCPALGSPPHLCSFLLAWHHRRLPLLRPRWLPGQQLQQD